MFHFLKKHAAAAAKESASPEGAASVSRSAGDRLDSSLAVSVGLCVLVFIVLQWMGSYSPHWGKSIWHHVSEAFLLFFRDAGADAYVLVMRRFPAQEKQNLCRHVGAVLVQLLFLVSSGM